MSTVRASGNRLLASSIGGLENLDPGQAESAGAALCSLAVGLLVFCLAWQLSTFLPTAFEEVPPHPGGQVCARETSWCCLESEVVSALEPGLVSQVPSAAGSMTLRRSLAEDEASLLEAAFQLVAEHSLQIEGAKQKWSEAILPALHAAAGDIAAIVHLGPEHLSEEAFLRYAKA